MGNFFKGLLTAVIDPTRIGGWARGFVASVLTALVATWALKFPVIAQVITPDTIVYLSVAVGTFVTGLLSDISKKA
jgi:hypothetical protein